MNVRIIDESLSLREVLKCNYCDKIIYIRTYTAARFKDYEKMNNERTDSQEDAIMEHAGGECQK
jgi:hypothetical protein